MAPTTGLEYWLKFGMRVTTKVRMMAKLLAVAAQYVDTVNKSQEQLEIYYVVLFLKEIITLIPVAVANYAFFVFSGKQ